jgi:hypothetical protein
VTWTASAVAPGLQSIDLQLSRNGTSGPWEPIAAGLPDTGTYRWVAAAPFSNAARVRVIARDYAGVLGTDVSTSDFVIGATLGVEPVASGAAFTLGRVAPQPLVGRAMLSYALPHRTNVRVTLLDVQGRELTVLTQGEREAGRYNVPLEGASLPPGLHFVRLQAPGVDLRQRVVTLR